MYYWAILAFLFILVAWSLWMRICHLRKSIESVDIKPSPFSAAVQDLVATAGGVYLSIIALVSFLKLDLPEKMQLAGVAFDPIALLAIVIAVTQPLWRKLFSKE